jgi:hypothetical protein
MSPLRRIPPTVSEPLGDREVVYPELKSDLPAPVSVAIRYSLLRGLGAVLVAAVGMLALARFVVATDAGIEYDDAVYLYRGLYHAAQVSERDNFLLPRLVWSLGFEAPKPPLFHGLLALAALTFGRTHVGALLVAGTLLPLLALASAIFVFARRAAGTRSGLFALLAYFAMPAALGLGTRLLTETTLAVTVVVGAFFAWRRATGGGLADELAVGVCGGLSLLAKLLGPLFLAPAVLVAVLACANSAGWRRAARFAAVVAALTALVAGPWYLRNGEAAFAFARFARTQESCLYAGPWWMRPVDFVRGSLGWPLALVVLPALALLALRRPAGAAVVTLRWMVLAAATVSALVIGAQPMFDPRFWLPSASLLAVWVGIELDALWKRARPAWRTAVVAAAAALVTANGYALTITSRPQMPWQAAPTVGRIGVTSRSRVALRSAPVLCTLGSSLDWNVEKVRLLVELSGVRPRPEVSDLLVDGRAVDVDAKLARCDVLFALLPRQIPAVANQRALNAGLPAGWAALERRRAEFAPAPATAAALGSRAEPQVFVRRGA